MTQTNVNEMLAGREARYGTFDGHAKISQALKRAMQDSPECPRSPGLQAGEDVNTLRVGMLVRLPSGNVVRLVRSGREQRPEHTCPVEASTAVSGNACRSCEGGQDGRRSMSAGGCRTRGSSDMLNADLWRELHAEADRTFARFQWVKAHSGIRLNERADRLAAQGRAQALFPGQMVASSA